MLEFDLSKLLVFYSLDLGHLLDVLVGMLLHHCPSTLGACFDKYLDVFSCPKVSQKLELRKATNQALTFQCTVLSLIRSSFGLGLVDLPKGLQNDLQLHLLEG